MYLPALQTSLPGYRLGGHSEEELEDGTSEQNLAEIRFLVEVHGIFR